ncbi:hypothetical protein ACHQM5_008986 [Ranunculus cassubicifolius]
MGTKVHCKSYTPVGYSMNDLNNNAKSGSWPSCYDDKSLTAGRRSYDHLLQRETMGGYSESEKEVLKQAMLKHETIFRKQVYELHRVYRIQKDIMDKLRRKELPNNQVSEEDTDSRPLPSPILSEGAKHLWRAPQIPLERSWSRPPTSNFSSTHPLLNINNKHSLIDCESLESKSKKYPIKKFDLQLPVDEYLACEKTENAEQENGTRVMVEEDNPPMRLSRSVSENDSTDGDPNCQGDPSNSGIDTVRKCVLADLNEPVNDEEETTDAPCQGNGGGKNFCSKPNSVFVGLSMEYLQHTWNERDIENHSTLKYISGLNCTDVTFAKGKDLNTALRNGLQLGLSPQQDPVTGNEGKIKDLSTWSSMFRMKPTSRDEDSQEREAPNNVEIDFFLGISQHSTCKVVRREISTASSVQNSASLSSESKSANTEKVHGFPIVNRPHASKGQLSLGFLSNSFQCSSEEVGHLANPNSGQKLSPDSLFSCKGFNQYVRDYASHIGSLSKTTMKKTPNIDLGYPVDLSIPTGLSTREDNVEQEQLMKIAAESIVVISNSRGHCNSHDVTSNFEEASDRETLVWFAEVITSPTVDLENKVCMDDDDDALCGGMDYFESMTLKLAETNVEDEHIPKQLVLEYSEEAPVASSLMTQRCRGKGRRGGQQRNFQRDILPSFACLTRHEISEDLEMLEGLMKSMGQSWPIGTARRNTAKNGRATGKGRSRGSSKK